MKRNTTSETSAENNASDQVQNAVASARTRPVEEQAEVSAEVDGRDDYVVTKLAGPKVAGKRVKAGEELRLTEPEARCELLTGALVQKGSDLPKGLDPKSKTKADEVA